VGNSRPALRLLLGAVGCASDCLRQCRQPVAGPVGGAVQGVRRAIRTGADRLRLVRQLLIESSRPCSGGGWEFCSRDGASPLGERSARSLPRLDEIRLDGSVLGFTLLISLLTGLIFGLAPACMHFKARSQ
jgi:putative ABC transport system permease protein